MRISDWSSDVCSSDLEELNGAPAIHGKLAADKVHSLHPIRAFVDHGDAGIADILLHARFHDVAVTAKHLLRIGCDFIALVSATALDDGSQQRNEIVRRLPFLMGRSIVDKIDL